jgi:hypothetical protein
LDLVEVLVFMSVQYPSTLVLLGIARFPGIDTLSNVSTSSVGQQQPFERAGEAFYSGK